MDNTLLYLLKVTVTMLLLYGLYHVLLRRNTSFRLQRLYLLFSIVFSWLLPLVPFRIGDGQGSGLVGYVLQAVPIFPAIPSDAAGDFSFVQMGGILWLAGTLFFFVRLLLRLRAIVGLHRNSVPVMRSGLRVRACREEVAPFSFFGTIYVGPGDNNTADMEMILVHESVHVRQWHSMDVLVSELNSVAGWFIPGAWMIRSALKETHEYLADSGVKELTTDTAGYFQLLFRHVVGVQPGLANNFNKSLTLKRMKMMTKKNTSRYSFLKLLLVIPFLALLITAFSARNNRAFSIIDPSVIMTEYTDDQQPQFPGGHDAMVQYLIKNVNYPADAKQKGIQGKVFVKFVVTKSGKVSQVAVVEPVNPLLDAEAIRVVSAMPDWTPGKVNGKTADIQMTVPIQFKLQ